MDLDADGHPDLLSGSWPGEIFVFRGGPGRTFGAPVMLRDKDGEVINVGGGVRESDGQILITGHATFEKKDGKTVVKLHDKTIEVPEGKSAGITGCASSVFAFDWDGDGDPDLLCGDIGGSVWLIPNEGAAGKYAFGKPAKLAAGGKAIGVAGGDAGPAVADWDGDGRPDLVVGCGDGGVVWFRNTGTRTRPELAKAETLVPPGEIDYDATAPREPRRGIRAKVCVADWDGDGRPDLLVGDCATRKPDRPDPTAEEKAEQDKVRKELEAARKRFSELIGKRREVAKEKDKEAKDRYEKDLREASETMQKLSVKLPPEYEMHGWVWVFVRTPAGKAAGR